MSTSNGRGPLERVRRMVALYPTRGALLGAAEYYIHLIENTSDPTLWENIDELRKAADVLTMVVAIEPSKNGPEKYHWMTDETEGWREDRRPKNRFEKALLEIEDLLHKMNA